MRTAIRELKIGFIKQLTGELVRKPTGEPIRGLVRKLAGESMGGLIRKIDFL